MKIKTILACVALACFAASTFAGTCSGGKNCRACSNCRYCQNCSKNGGTCSVCSPWLYRAQKQSKKPQRHSHRVRIAERSHK
jgi:hypothetical protein